MAAGGLMARPDDRYANVGAVSVVESAANTLTFAELDFGIGLGAGVGLLIDQVDYFIDPATLVAGLTSVADAVIYGVSTVNTLTDLTTEFDNKSLVHMASIQKDYVTSGSWLWKFPDSHQFFPPLIVGTNRGSLYLAVQGVSAAAAITVRARIYFRYIPLTDREYLELAEAFNLMG